MTRHAVFVLPALFCIALGVFIGYLLWYQPDEEPEESNVVDLPVRVRRHPRLVRSEEG